MSAAPAAGVRILLLRPDHLGDVLLTLPTAQLLRRLLPEAHIAVAVVPGLTPIATRCPAIDEVLAVDFPAPTAADMPDGWEARALRAADALRGRFDVALIPRLDDPWSGYLAALAGIARRIGYGHARTRPYLTEALPLPGRCHVVTLGLMLAQAVAGSGDDSRAREPWVVPQDQDDAEVDSVFATLRGASRLKENVIAFHPGASWVLKEWPPERWGTLIGQLSGRYKMTALVTGGRHEREMVETVVEASGGAAIGLAGRLSLGGLAALYRKATLVVAIDSGPLHLATAVGTPVVGIYGPADVQEFGPWGPGPLGRVLQSNLSCQPCRRLEYPPCGALVRPACMHGIEVSAVLAAVEEALTRCETEERVNRLR